MILDVSAANGTSNILFDSGLQYPRLTGGWIMRGKTDGIYFTHSLGSTLYVEQTTNHTDNSSLYNCGPETQKGILLAGKSILKFEGSIRSVWAQFTPTLGLGTSKLKSLSTAGLDLTALSLVEGELYKIRLYLTSQGYSGFIPSKMDISKLWLE